MGNLFSSLFASLFGTRDVRILILGLDNAGKTTILYRLRLDEVVPTLPTIGFNVETVRHRNVTFQVWDLGGQTSIRPFWRCYYPNTEAIIFVVDSADPDRLSDARSELHMMLAEEELSNVLLLVFANKQDLPGICPVEEITAALDLASLRSHQWTIIPTSGLKGTGIFEGLEWLTTKIPKS